MYMYSIVGSVEPGGSGQFPLRPFRLLSSEFGGPGLEQHRPASFERFRYTAASCKFTELILCTCIALLVVLSPAALANSHCVHFASCRPKLVAQVSNNIAQRHLSVFGTLRPVVNSPNLSYVH